MTTNTTRKATLKAIKIAGELGYEVVHDGHGWSKGPCYHRLGGVCAMAGEEVIHAASWDTGARRGRVSESFRTSSKHHLAVLEVLRAVAEHADNDEMRKLLRPE